MSTQTLRGTPNDPSQDLAIQTDQDCTLDNPVRAVHVTAANVTVKLPPDPKVDQTHRVIASNLGAVSLDGNGHAIDGGVTGVPAGFSLVLTFSVQNTWAAEAVGGTVGPQGATGPKGATGATGPQGFTGATGPALLAFPVQTPGGSGNMVLFAPDGVSGLDGGPPTLTSAFTFPSDANASLSIAQSFGNAIVVQPGTILAPRALRSTRAPNAGLRQMWVRNLNAQDVTFGFSTGTGIVVPGGATHWALIGEDGTNALTIASGT